MSSDPGPASNGFPQPESTRRASPRRRRSRSRRRGRSRRRRQHRQRRRCGCPHRPRRPRRRRLGRRRRDAGGGSVAADYGPPTYGVAPYGPQLATGATLRLARTVRPAGDAGRRRRPGADDGRAQGRVHRGAADQGRVRRADRPGARRADLRGPERPGRRPARRARRAAGAGALPGGLLPPLNMQEDQRVRGRLAGLRHRPVLRRHPGGHPRARRARADHGSPGNAATGWPSPGSSSATCGSRSGC